MVHSNDKQETRVFAEGPANTEHAGMYVVWMHSDTHDEEGKEYWYALPTGMPVYAGQHGRVDCSCGAVLLPASDESLKDNLEATIQWGCQCRPALDRAELVPMTEGPHAGTFVFKMPGNVVFPTGIPHNNNVMPTTATFPVTGSAGTSVGEMPASRDSVTAVVGDVAAAPGE